MPIAATHSVFNPRGAVSQNSGVLDRAQQRAEAKRKAARVITRRPGREQGMALEALGHAVDYLIDSRMFLDMPYTRAEEEAVQILMGLSRQVFETCPQVIPLRTRVADGLLRLVLGAEV